MVRLLPFHYQIFARPSLLSILLWFGYSSRQDIPLPLSPSGLLSIPILSVGPVLTLLPISSMARLSLTRKLFPSSTPSMDRNSSMSALPKARSLTLSSSPKRKSQSMAYTIPLEMLAATICTGIFSSALQKKWESLKSWTSLLSWLRGSCQRAKFKSPVRLLLLENSLKILPEITRGS